MKTYIFYPMAIFFVIASLLISSCAAMAPAEPTPTNTPVPPTETPEPTLTPTRTVTPTITPSPTITPNSTATQQVQDFMTRVEEYHEAGYISTTEGTYRNLKNYSDAWAQINYYQWLPTGLSPSNFIIRSDISWESASAAANSSGCGYVFRLQENTDHYMFFISLKGYIEVATNVSNRWKSIGRATFGNPAQSGKANVTLIAEDDTFRVLVDDKLLKVYTGFSGKLMRGDLAYTIVSGINTSFGTRCNFENTEFWTIVDS